ncbi:MAG TPA: glycosyltransferase family 2 protein [Pyrinomonadaceae bacterium]|nr:glycosyltransferase family 2 protein [Pyrinomonadaceae bacterium]
MYKKHRIAVIIPAHNEARHIGQVIRGVPEFVDYVIVVDDNSRDATGEIALAIQDPRLILLRTTQQEGVGGAVILGYRKGVGLGSDLLVKMDGDGQMPPESLSSLLDAVIDQGYDYAKGNRFLAGESLAQMPKHRLFGNVLLTFMTKLASGYWHIFDPQNGYTVIKADALRVLDLDRINKRYFFENDVLVQLNFFSFRVKDVAIPACYGEEESGISLFQVGFTFPVLLLRRYFRRIYQKYVLRDFSPIALFLFLGLALFSWGSSFGVYIWIKSYATGHPTAIGTIMVALLPLILGFQLLLQAFVMDIQETPK